MKGLTQMMWVVMTAIIVIVVALVLLIVFADVLDDPIFEFKNQCELRAKTTCRTSNSLPPDWNFEDSSLKTSCKDQFGYTECPTEWLQ